MCSLLASLDWSNSIKSGSIANNSEASWLKITGMVKKLQKMSNRVEEESKALTPKQKEFVDFLEKASNQSKEKNNA